MRDHGRGRWPVGQFSFHSGRVCVHLSVFGGARGGPPRALPCGCCAGRRRSCIRACGLAGRPAARRRRPDGSRGGRSVCLHQPVRAKKGHSFGPACAGRSAAGCRPSITRRGRVPGDGGGLRPPPGRKCGAPEGAAGVGCRTGGGGQGEGATWGHSELGVEAARRRRASPPISSPLSKKPLFRWRFCRRSARPCARPFWRQRRPSFTPRRTSTLALCPSRPGRRVCLCWRWHRGGRWRAW